MKTWSRGSVSNKIMSCLLAAVLVTGLNPGASWAKTSDEAQSSQGQSQSQNQAQQAPEASAQGQSEAQQSESDAALATIMSSADDAAATASEASAGTDAVAAASAAAAAQTADSKDATLEAGTYTVTANLVMPGKYNPVLSGVDVYANSANNPFGPTLDENDAATVEKVVPNTAESMNATLYVDASGNKTLILPVKNPVFILRDLGTCDTMTNIQVEQVTATKWRDYAYGEQDESGTSTGYDGTYGSASTRIHKISFGLTDTETTGTASYNFKNSKMLAVPLGFAIEPVGDIALTLSVDYSTLQKTSTDTTVPTLQTEKKVVNTPKTVDRFYNGEEQEGLLVCAAGSEAQGFKVTEGEANATELGSHKVTVSLVSDDYVWADGTTAPKTLTWNMNKTKLTVTYAGESVHVGETPELKLTVEGFLEGDSAETAKGYVAPSIKTYDTSAVGQYELVAEGGQADIYDFEYVPGILNVTNDTLTTAVPSPKEGLAYTGVSQDGFADSIKYEVVSGGSAVDAGTYTAQIKPKTGYVWEDGTQDTVSVEWSIAKAELKAYSYLVQKANELHVPTADEVLANLTYEGLVNNETAETAKGYVAPTYKGVVYPWDASLERFITDDSGIEAENGYKIVFEGGSFDNYTVTWDYNTYLYGTHTIQSNRLYTCMREASVPAENTTITYNGDTQFIVQSVSGGYAWVSAVPGYPNVAQLNAGSYTTKVEPMYPWPDGTFDAVDVSGTIEPATLSASYSGETSKQGTTPKLEVTVETSDDWEGWEEPTELENYVAPTIAVPEGYNSWEEVPAGTYELTPAKGDAGSNYQFEYTAGTLTVLPASEYVDVESVSFDKTSISMTTAEGTPTITATVLPENATNGSVRKWSSSDPSVISVTEDGSMYVRKGGTTTITLEVDGKKASCDITIKQLFVTEWPGSETGTWTKVYDGTDSRPEAPEGTYWDENWVPSEGGFTHWGSSIVYLNLENGYYWPDGDNWSRQRVQWEVTEAPLTASYAGETITAGETPKLEVTYDGFVNGETAETAYKFTAPTFAIPEGYSSWEELPAGTYELTPANGSANDYDITYQSGTLTVKGEAEAPVAASDLVYNGSEQVGVAEGAGYTLSGDAKATIPGTYTATATLMDGCTWTDGTTEPKVITWSMAAGDYTGLVAGTYTVSANLVMPGKYNPVLTGIDVYACNPNNPFGPTIDENTAIKDTISNAAPTTAVANNATLTVGANGGYTLTMNTPNPIFTLQNVGESRDGGLSDIKAEYVTATKMHGNTSTWEGKYSLAGNITSRVHKVQMSIVEPSKATGEVTYELKNSKMYAVPLSLEFDITTTSGDAGPSLNFIVDYGTANKVSDSTAAATLATDATVVNIPEAVELDYTGSEVEGVYTNAGYDLTGEAKATAAGTHTATATLKDGYVWSDGTTDAKTIEWKITKATPSYEAPTDLTATYGQTLADVKLPEGFSWQDDPATFVGNAGTNTFKAKFTPSDTANYNVVEDIAVAITVSAIKVAAPEAATDLVYNGSEQTGVAEGEGYTLSGNTATKAGTYKATATLKDNYVWADGTSEPKVIEWSIAAAEPEPTPDPEPDSTPTPTPDPEPAPEPSSDPVVFEDVDYNNPDCKWYVDGVNFCASKGLIKGYSNLDGNPTGYFGVGNTLTRAELAVILWRHFEPEAAAAYDEAATAAAKGVTSANGVSVSGIADGAWYTAAANWAIENGIINGFERADGSRDFAPDTAVSFEQLIAIIANASGADVAKADTSVLAKFSDGASVSSWAAPSMAYAVESGLVSGYDGKVIAPGEDVKRERVATVLMNAFEKGVLK